MALRAQHLVRTTGNLAERHHRAVPRPDPRVGARAPRREHARVSGTGTWDSALEADDDAIRRLLATHWAGALDAPRAARYAIIAATARPRRSRSTAPRASTNRRSRWGRHPTWTSRLCRDASPTRCTNGGRDAEAATARMELAERAVGIEALDLRRRSAEQFLYSGHFDCGIEILKSVFASVSLSFPTSTLGIVVGLLFFRVVLKLRGLAFRERPPAEITPARSCESTFSAPPGKGWRCSRTCMAPTSRQGASSWRSMREIRTGSCARFRLEARFDSIGGTRARETSMDLLGSTQALATKLGTPEALALSHVAAGFRHFFFGEWAPSRDSLLQAEALFRDQCLGVAFELTSVRIILYRTLVYTGQLKKLAASAIPVLRDVEHRGDRHSSVMLRATALAHIGLAADEPDSSSQRPR